VKHGWMLALSGLERVLVQHYWERVVLFLFFFCFASVGGITEGSEKKIPIAVPDGLAIIEKDLA
jgi:hypothetical protein